MSKRIPFQILLGFSCCLGGCATTTYPTFEDHRRELQNRLSEVVVDDGIDEMEANVIARSYFHRSGIGCGAVYGVTDDGSVWIAKTVVGIAAMPTREPIRIDKISGRVTWSNGPTIDDPKAIWLDDSPWPRFGR